MSEHRKRRVRITARAILVHDGHVLMLKGHDSGGGPWYVLPGGGVEHGEPVHDAVAREMIEETGIKVVPERLLYIREFIPERHPGRAPTMPVTNHVVALIFLCKPCPQTYEGVSVQEIGEFPGDVDGTGGIIGQEWLPLDQVSQLDLRPPHLKAAFSGEFPPQDGFIGFWQEENPPLPADQ